jgi:hypothetical protein
LRRARVDHLQGHAGGIIEHALRRPHHQAHPHEVGLAARAAKRDDARCGNEQSHAYGSTHGAECSRSPGKLELTRFMRRGLRGAKRGAMEN